MIDRRGAALFGRLWRQHRAALFTMAVGVALFEFVITRVAPAPGELGFLSGLIALLPRQTTALLGGELALASPMGVIAFGYVHPFFIALLSAWTIRVASGALAGEIGRGTMDLLASRPVPRWSQVLAAWVATAAGLALLVAAAWTGTAVGLELRPLGATPRQVAGLPALAWMLFMGWASLAVLVSAMRREAGSAIAWITGLIASSFVLDFLARVWQPAAWARPVSLFAYYRPQDLVRSGLDVSDAVCLGGVALAGLAAAVLIFERRDL